MAVESRPRAPMGVAGAEKVDLEDVAPVNQKSKVAA